MMLFTSRAPMASGFMVAWWGVRRVGSPGRWWAVTASWLGSCCCWMMPWRVVAVWCCARVRRGSGRPGWRRRPPRRPLRGACRWRGLGWLTGTACRRTACGGWCWMSPPSGPPMMILPVWACGRASSVTRNARRWLMAPIPAATSGSRCSRRSDGGWRRRPGRAGCCWCSTICSGRTRRRRSCSQMSCASCEGRSSWCWRPTGSRRPPVLRAPGCCRVCRRMPTPNGWTFVACPPARSGICCSPPGCRHRQTRPVRCTPKRGATRSWSASWPACSPSSGAAGRCRCRDGGGGAPAPRRAQLSDPARALVQTAAVAGNSFSAGVVARILDVPVLALLGPLDECRGAGFLVAGDRPGDHRFSHALVRSAVAARLGAAEQRRLHTAAAGAIEALYEGQLDLRLTEVARHRVEASLPGDRAEAVAACEAGAGVAAQSLAFEEAVRLYRQALSVGEGEIGENDRSRLELALAAALHRSGDLPGSQETAAGVGRRAERRRDRLWLARTALVVEASRGPGWGGGIRRICAPALAGEALPGGLRARVSSRYAQALVYRGEYDRAGQVSRDALAAAGSAGDPVALVDALHARQLACCAPDGVAERAVLASRMLEAADAAGSAWLEMWGRLWRIDTLFETGQLRSVRRELADLEVCVERLPGPLAQWQFLETSATLALATGRFTEAMQLAWQAFKVFSGMGHPVAFGGCSVILGQAGLHIGFGRSGMIELWDQIPAHLRPDAVDTTRGVATVFPALTLALIRLHQGDRAAAEAAYAQAGPVRSWTPVPAMRMAAWAHGLPVAIRLGRTQDIEFLAAQFEPFRGQHVANGAGPGVYMGPVELPLGQAAAALGHLGPAVEDLQTAASICDANGARGCAVQARVELAAALTRRQAPGDRDE